MEFVQKFARPLLTFLVDTIPVIISVSQTIYKAYSRLPTEYVHLIAGAIMCFFGGFYPTLFAALQVSLMCFVATDSFHLP